MIFFLFLIKIYCDNIEIKANAYKKIIFNNVLINIPDLRKFNSIKISYSCDCFPKIVTDNPDLLKIEDVAIHYNQNQEVMMQIDYEYKIFGLAHYVYYLICFCIIVTIFIIMIFINFNFFDVEEKETKYKNMFSHPFDQL